MAGHHGSDRCHVMNGLAWQAEASRPYSGIQVVCCNIRSYNLTKIYTAFFVIH